ncbi:MULTISPECIES: hypothetical protein [unclassified Curtobacterium]|uniref:hypothetical protein n=1 Tax=unclassified Curtobacterium TaxID=257496 RepID=UPI003A8064CD
MKMRSDLDGTDLFNLLMMDPPRAEDSLVVVEGESDFNLLADFLRSDKVDVVVGYGKRSLLEAAVLASSALTRAVFLVDADFDRLNGAADAYPDNVVLTDMYDLYMDACNADELCLRRVSRRYLEETELDPQEGVTRAFDAALQIGAVRFASIVNEHFLNMKQFPLRQVMDKSSLAVGIRDVVELALLRTEHVPPNKEAIVGEAEVALKEVDVWLLVNSHDLLSALRFCFECFSGVKIAHRLDDLFELSIDRAVFDNLPVIERVRSRLSAPPR